MLTLTVTWPQVVFAWLNLLGVIGLVLWLALRRKDSDQALVSIMKTQQDASATVVKSCDSMIQNATAQIQLLVSSTTGTAGGQVKASNEAVSKLVDCTNRLVATFSHQLLATAKRNGRAVTQDDVREAQERTKQDLQPGLIHAAEVDG